MLKTRVDTIQEAQAQPKSNSNSNKKKRRKKKSKPKKSPSAITIEIDASSSHDCGSNLENESRRGIILEKASRKDLLQSAHHMREHDSRRSEHIFVPRPVSDILQSAHPMHEHDLRCSEDILGCILIGGERCIHTNLTVPRLQGAFLFLQ